jgi:hypothetical protein
MHINKTSKSEIDQQLLLVNGKKFVIYYPAIIYFSIILMPSYIKIVEKLKII